MNSIAFIVTCIFFAFFTIIIRTIKRNNVKEKSVNINECEEKCISNHNSNLEQEKNLAKKEIPKKISLEKFINKNTDLKELFNKLYLQSILAKDNLHAFHLEGDVLTGGCISFNGIFFKIYNENGKSESYEGNLFDKKIFFTSDTTRYGTWLSARIGKSEDAFLQYGQEEFSTSFYQINYQKKEELLKYYKDLEEQIIKSFSKDNLFNLIKTDDKLKEKIKRLKKLNEVFLDRFLKTKLNKCEDKDYNKFICNSIDKLYKEQKKLEKKEEQKLFEECYTKENSSLYKKLLELNAAYDRTYTIFQQNICKNHVFEHHCKSKKEFDKFDYENFFVKKVKEDLAFYKDFPNVINEVKNNYLSYTKKYEKAKSLFADEANYCLDINFEKFSENEHYLYDNNKRGTPALPTVEIILFYNSPTFRNQYKGSKVFDYNEILILIEKASLPDEKIEKISENKRIRMELEQLREQVKLLSKGHIYSSSSLEKDIIEEKEASLGARLNKLRKSFENNEITKEEYIAKRKELMN